MASVGEWRSVLDLLPHVFAALSGLITLLWVLRRRLRLPYVVAGSTALAVLAAVWIAVHLTAPRAAIVSNSNHPFSFPEVIGRLNAVLDTFTDDECHVRRFLDLTTLARLALDESAASAALRACRRVLNAVPGLQSVDDQHLIYLVVCLDTTQDDAVTRWNLKLWARLCQGYPYALDFSDHNYMSLKRRTLAPEHLGHMPMLRADWLLAVRWSELPGLKQTQMSSEDVERDLRSIKSWYDSRLSLAGAAAELWLANDEEFKVDLQKIKRQSSLIELEKLLRNEGVDRAIWDASQDADCDSRWKSGADSLWQHVAKGLGMGEPWYALPDAKAQTAQ